MLLVIFIILSMSAASTALATPTPLLGAGQQMQPTDDRLERQVKAALSSDPVVESFEIVVTAFEGNIRLNGAVDSDEERAHAGSAAAEVEGVGKVENRITVGRSLLMTDKTDADIRRDILERVARSHPEEHIEVNVEDGLATLVGEVASSGVRKAMTKIAFRAGALLVRNQLTVEADGETSPA